MADEVTRPRPIGEEEVQDIQITLRSDANPIGVRDMKVSAICYYYTMDVYLLQLLAVKTVFCLYVHHSF